MVKHSIAIGVIVAVLLSLIRGGITDSFTTLVIFGLTGFFASLFLSWLFSNSPFRAIDNSLASVPQAAFVRSVLSITLIFVLLFWSGSFIRSGGYGGWILFLLASFLAPLAVCILAPRFSIAVGVCTATCITCSLLIADSRCEIERGNVGLWEDFWNGDSLSYVVIWLVATVLSLPTSVAIHFKRRMTDEAVAKPDEAKWPQHGDAPLSHSVSKSIAIVTVPLLMIFVAHRIDNKLHGIRVEYLEKHNEHNAAVHELIEAEYGKPVTTLSELTELEKEYALKHPEISWHREMSKKYWRAYHYPWFPVPPDNWPQE